jgi:hypothetical protein
MVTSGKTTALLPLMTCGSRIIVPRVGLAELRRNGRTGEAAAREIVGLRDKACARRNTAKIADQNAGRRR